MKQPNFFIRMNKDGTGLDVSCTSVTADKLDACRDYGDLIAYLVRVANENGIPDELVSLMCSSSLDFPDEYTEDEVVIALCDKIRNGE